MILKFDLSGEEHRALIEALHSDANHYAIKHDRFPDKREPYARIVDDPIDKNRAEHDYTALPPRRVVLDMRETFGPYYVGDQGPVPLNALTNILIAIGRFPSAS